MKKSKKFGMTRRRGIPKPSGGSSQPFLGPLMMPLAEGNRGFSAALNSSQLLRNSFAERFDSGAYAGWIFFNWHEFVAALLGLPSEFRLESLFTLGISFCPNRGIVFDLFLNHRVEDDSDFVGSRRGSANRAKFALHPAKIVSHRSLVVM